MGGEVGKARRAVRWRGAGEVKCLFWESGKARAGTEQAGRRMLVKTT